MRILVGTLYSGEKEIDECLASIRAQTHPGFEHFVIEGLPKVEAHQELYRAFMTRASEFDLFMKVDADMVLLSDAFFSRVVGRMKSRSEILDLRIAVWDFFTRHLIIGLHIYRSCVRWEETCDRLFTDHNRSIPRRAVVNDCEDLAPAAIHCGDSTPFQSFHYGLHRGTKLMAIRAGLAPGSSPRCGHARNRELAWRAFLESRDPRHGWACLGYEIAIRDELGRDDVDYGNPRAQGQWCRYANLERPGLHQLVKSLRVENDDLLVQH